MRSLWIAFQLNPGLMLGMVVSGVAAYYGCKAALLHWARSSETAPVRVPTPEYSPAWRMR